MKASTINEIKQELLTLSQKQVVELCLRLGRFKKENKELLTYLLFEAHNETDYISSVKMEIDENFADINTSQLYFAKKSLRKIVRLINKYSRYSNAKETEVELRLYFCEALKDSAIPWQKNTLINNIYTSQVKKCMTLIQGMEEDLQYDYLKKVKEL